MEEKVTLIEEQVRELIYVRRKMKEKWKRLIVEVRMRGWRREVFEESGRGGFGSF